MLCPTFLIAGREVTVIGLAARFDTPVDVTVAELRIELLFPADPDSQDFFQERTADSVSGPPHRGSPE